MFFCSAAWSLRHVSYGRAGRVFTAQFALHQCFLCGFFESLCNGTSALFA